MKLLTLTLILILMGGLHSFADDPLLNFDFSFGGSILVGQTPQNGNGEVYGELLGVQNNSMSATPLDIIITSVGANGFNIPAPFDFHSGGNGTLEVENGVVDNGGVSVQSLDSLYALALGNGSPGNTFLDYNGSDGPVAIADYSGTGSPDVFYTYAGVYEAPEPSTYAMMGLGVLSLGGIRRFRNLSA